MLDLKQIQNVIWLNTSTGLRFSHQAMLLITAAAVMHATTRCPQPKRLLDGPGPNSTTVRRDPVPGNLPSCRTSPSRGPAEEIPPPTQDTAWWDTTPPSAAGHPHSRRKGWTSVPPTWHRARTSLGNPLRGALEVAGGGAPALHGVDPAAQQRQGLP